MANPENTVRLRVLVGFLKAGRVLDHGSSMLLLAALVLAARAGAGLEVLILGGAVLLGLLEKYLAWRVALDAEFFALLLKQPGKEKAFDEALAEFLGRPLSADVRPMSSRWRGARQLVRQQAAAVGAQALAMVAGVVYSAIKLH
ncbi:hypothetical protein MON38_10860 [Hymenobacter sp. DH14]|uniref:Uncharacterized protein n=1 Tax=Hymenobacter cyanobacteriorum TaxID=2926463 RepID=A0A9X1VFE0_9BACT|nr:hypothetical protein [Hymenobacter cyanobacteriorum]MCI1187921.1 hypothetical protein [Hymenobacter cyanobacteriorum]